MCNGLTAPERTKGLTYAGREDRVGKRSDRFRKLDFLLKFIPSASPIRGEKAKSTTKDIYTHKNRWQKQPLEIQAKSKGKGAA